MIVQEKDTSLDATCRKIQYTQSTSSQLWGEMLLEFMRRECFSFSRVFAGTGLQVTIANPIHFWCRSIRSICSSLPGSVATTAAEIASGCDHFQLDQTATGGHSTRPVLFCPLPEKARDRQGIWMVWSQDFHLERKTLF